MKHTVNSSLKSRLKADGDDASFEDLKHAALRRKERVFTCDE